MFSNDHQIKRFIFLEKIHLLRKLPSFLPAKQHSANGVPPFRHQRVYGDSAVGDSLQVETVSLAFFVLLSTNSLFVFLVSILSLFYLFVSKLQH